MKDNEGTVFALSVLLAFAVIVISSFANKLQEESNRASMAIGCLRGAITYKECFLKNDGE